VTRSTPIRSEAESARDASSADLGTPSTSSIRWIRSAHTWAGVSTPCADSSGGKCPFP
jgi:hypothetical protein